MNARRVNRSPAVAALLIIGITIGITISLSGTVPAIAQQAVASATLSGRIDDPAGASIRGVLIAITNIEKNQTTTSTTDQEGRYSFLYLPVGHYQLRVEHTGFAPVS